MNILKYFLIIIFFIIPFKTFSQTAFKSGNDAFLNADYETAIRYFNKSIKEEKNANAWYYLGISHLQLGLNKLTSAISIKSVYEKAKSDLINTEELIKRLKTDISKLEINIGKKIDTEKRIDELSYLTGNLDKANEKLIILKSKFTKAKEDYSTIRIYLKIAKHNIEKAKETLGIGLQGLNNSVEQNKYLLSIRQVADVKENINILESKLAEEDKESEDNFRFTMILVAIGIFVLVIIGFILRILAKKRQSKRNYKELNVSEELTYNLTLLNEEFRKTRVAIYNSNNQKAKDNIEEIEDRCIALNDKLEELKYGLRAIDVASFNDEIEFTREMLNECVKKIDEK
ncbi:MAG: hypothetical protein OEV44_13525 [Spirochaetota bacterium]|nr:hypothetical protein [Spirochaetota bacterium]